MKFGYVTMNSAAGIRPDVLARALEERGFESIWVPEHSNIPTSRVSAFPGGGDLPSGYFHMMDPMVSLAAAATVSKDLTIATGVCLILEHDLVALACQTATLDVLSGGRLLLGVGVGWNKEEFENHRRDIPFSKRYSALCERIEALRAIWANDEAEFAGTWDRVDRTFIYPKPVRRSISIAMGNAGPTGIRLAAKYADEWLPIDTSLPYKDGKPDVAGSIDEFRHLVETAGRDPTTIPITIFSFFRPTVERMERYNNLGVSRFVIAMPTTEVIPADDVLGHLDSSTQVMNTWLGSK